MAFHFALNTLLHYRKLKQHQHELQLERSLLIAARLRADIAAIDQKIAATQSQELRSLAQGLGAAEMHLHAKFIAALRDSKQVLADRLRKAELAAEEFRQSFLMARRDTEVVETIRQNQAAAYKKDQLRKQQRRLDDLSLLRRNSFKLGKSAE
jgi:flagellar export protein FliJ